MPVVLFFAEALEELAVGVEGEKEAGEVGGDENDGDFEAQSGFLARRGGSAEVMERGGHNERDGGEGHHARLGTRSGGIEAEDLVPVASGKAGGSENKEHVADDGAGERSLDDAMKALLQGDEGDDQLGGVSEGGVEKAADGFAGAGGEVLGGAAEPAGEGDDGQAGAQEDGDVPIRARELEIHADGYEQQEEVHQAEAPGVFSREAAAWFSRPSGQATRSAHNRRCGCGWRRQRSRPVRSGNAPR